MNLSDLFIVCSHGRRSAHGLAVFYPTEDPKFCPGGRPVTLEDLGGEKVWFCVDKEAQDWGFLCEDEDDQVDGHHVDCGWHLLIPLPQMVAGESLEEL